jgi:PEGA domain
MIHRSVRVAFLGAVVAVVAAQPLALGAGSSNEADSLIRHGIELRKAHDDEGAAREFQKAYDQVHTPRAAGQLGLAEQALGRWEDAERHVGEALHAAGDTWVIKNRATLDEALSAIQSHLARIEVIGDPEGADVSVNGRVVGKLPLQEPVRVSAGEVEVELHAPGYVAAQRTLSIVGGQYQRLVLHLTKEASASAGDAPSVTKVAGDERPPPESTPVTPLVATTPGAQEPSTARTVLKWSAAGLAGVGLVVGIVAVVEHGNSVAAFDNHTPACADNNGMAVDQKSGLPAPDCQGSLDGYRRDKTWAIVGFAGAGVFAVTWLVLQLTEGSGPAAAEHALAAPLCAPSSSGIGVGCAFRF